MRPGIFFCVSLALISQSVLGQQIFGTWKTIDEETGRARALVEIYEKEGKAYGKIIQTFPLEGEDLDPICSKCDGVDKDSKIIGMDIIRDMSLDGDTWTSGTILDAEHGKTYNCKLWCENGILKVRGYVAFFYRTQEWLPYQVQ